MNATNKNIQLLLEEVTFLYSIEKTIGSLLPELKSDDQHLRVQQGLRVEMEENGRQCERLRSLIELLVRGGTSSGKNEDTAEQHRRSLQLYRTFALRHQSVGYDTSMLVAEVIGRTDILQTLQYCLKIESEVANAPCLKSST